MISVLWLKIVGIHLDSFIDEEGLGNRLEKFDNPKSHKIFKYYYTQYNKWRDNAIKIAQSITNKKNNALLISLDIKDCYYSIQPNWKNIAISIKSRKVPLNSRVIELLNSLLENIHNTYHEKIHKYISWDRKGSSDIVGLPISLPSSAVLANWELNKLDDLIKQKLTPEYYGRYVDDILIIIRESQGRPLVSKTEIFDKYFVKNGLLSLSSLNENNERNKQEYYFNDHSTLKINPSKIIIHYYNFHNSLAGLTEFRRELDKQASEFRFLPVSDDNENLAEFAYDLMVKGSINKIRNIIDVSENDTELSKYLTRRIIEYKLTAKNKSKKVIDQVFRFYQGRNILDYCRLWEKVFSFLIITKDYKSYKEAFINFYKIINKIDNLVRDKEISVRVKSDLIKYLLLSAKLPITLLSRDLTEEQDFKNEILRLKREIEISEQDVEYLFSCQNLRSSNLFRHDYVSWPLINYTDYNGSLLDFKPLSSYLDIEFSNSKKEYSPRYIHLDEFLLFSLLQNLAQRTKTSKTQAEERDIVYDVKDLVGIYGSEYGFNCDAINITNWENPDTPSPKSINTIEQSISQDIATKNNCSKKIKNYSINVNKYSKLNLSTDTIKNNSRIIVGFANFKVSEENIKASYHPDKEPNTCNERKQELFELLNESIKNKPCDLVIFPEVSIPFAWLPMMVTHARTKGTGMVFGLEHVITGKLAWNLVITLLPYENSGGYRNCLMLVRVKNHYSPLEEYSLNRFGLSKPSTDPYYEIINWNGCSFTVYNCFELSDIVHRSVFRSHLDMLIAIEWNPDTNYYSNIIESCVRDLHCYAVQVNTSQYGDSRITYPVKSERMNLVRITGGDSALLLKKEIEFETLRDFQLQSFSPKDERYKPKPAGFDSKAVLKRRLK
jgi:hypothetical protein